MATTVTENKYCNYIAQCCVNYTSDRQKYSPNNIRRIIISPDAISVTLFVGKSSGKLLDANLYRKCIASENYVSMVSVLGASGNRVCSHVEEIVFCTQGTNGMSLHNSEANWRKLINPNKSINTDEDFRKAISDRYKRLRAIIIYNGTYRQFTSTVKTRTSMGYLISEDVEAIGKLNLQIIDFHKTDWWKGTYFRPAEYPIDAEGTQLHTIISNYKKVREEQEKEQQLKDYKAQRFAKYEEEYRKSYDRLKKVLAIYKKTILTLKNKPAYMLNISNISITPTNLSNITDKIVDPFDIADNGVKQELSLSGVTVNTDKGIQESEINESIKNMTGFCLSMYTNMTSIFISFMKFVSEYKLTDLKKEYLREYEDGVFIPPNIRNQAEELGIKTKTEFSLSSVTRLSRVLINICSTEVRDD